MIGTILTAVLEVICLIAVVCYVQAAINSTMGNVVSAGIRWFYNIVKKVA